MNMKQKLLVVSLSGVMAKANPDVMSPANPVLKEGEVPSAKAIAKVSEDVRSKAEISAQAKGREEAERFLSSALSVRESETKLLARVAKMESKAVAVAFVFGFEAEVNARAKMGNAEQQLAAATVKKQVTYMNRVITGVWGTTVGTGEKARTVEALPGGAKEAVAILEAPVGRTSEKLAKFPSTGEGRKSAAHKEKTVGTVASTLPVSAGSQSVLVKTILEAPKALVLEVIRATLKRISADDIEDAMVKAIARDWSDVYAKHIAHDAKEDAAGQAANTNAKRATAEVQ